MTKLDHFKQSTIERKLYTVDYSKWLEVGETMTSVVYEIRKVLTGAITTEATVTHDGIVGGTNIRFYFSRGVNGTQYRVEIQATTSLNQTTEDYILFTVVDP